MTYKTDTATEVKLLRISAGLNQDQLATLLDIPVAAVIAWERGHVGPDFVERAREAITRYQEKRHAKAR